MLGKLVGSVIMNQSWAVIVSIYLLVVRRSEQCCDVSAWNKSQVLLTHF